MLGSEVRFYKYLSPESCLSVLQDGALRWGSPQYFNDPFDFPSNIDFVFDAEELSNALIDEAIKLIYGSEEPIGNHKNDIFVMALAARRKQGGPSEAESRKFWESQKKFFIDNFTKVLSERRKFFADERERYRVLCLSKTKTELLMWAHYCKSHTGCVLEFRCLPEMDRPICAAQEVRYLDSYPIFASLEELVKQGTGQFDLDYHRLINDFFLSKSSHWSYEQEWRCVYPGKSDGGYDLISWVPEELESIYIGCNATSDFRKNIVDCISVKSPNTKIYQSKIDLQSYRLLFDQL